MPAFRRLTAATVAVVTAGLLLPAPSHAALTDGAASASANLHDDDDGCVISPTPSEGVSRTLSDDGRSVTVTDSRTATDVGSDPADKVTLAGTTTATTTVSPITATGGLVRFTGSASASVSARLSESDCEAHAAVGSESSGTLRLPVPMWVTATVVASGGIYAEVRIWNDDLESHGSQLGRGTVTTRALLPAGSAGFDVVADVDSFQTEGGGSVAGSGAVTIALRPIGAPSAIAGTGGRFVALGGRSCASNSVASTLTTRIKKAKRVEILVNGTRRFKASGKRIKPRAIALSVPPTAPASVTAVITPKKGKKVTVTRSYLACG